MNHLSNFYKNKSEQLQERYNQLLDIAKKINILNEEEDIFKRMEKRRGSDLKGMVNDLHSVLRDISSKEELKYFLDNNKTTRNSPGDRAWVTDQWERTHQPKDKLLKGIFNTGRATAGIAGAFPMAIGTDIALETAGLTGFAGADTIRGALSTSAGMGVAGGVISALTPENRFQSWKENVIKKEKGLPPVTEKPGELIPGHPTWSARPGAKLGRVASSAGKAAGLGLAYGAMWEPASWVSSNVLGLCAGTLPHTVSSSLLSQAAVDIPLMLAPGAAPVKAGRVLGNMLLWGVGLPSATHLGIHGLDQLINKEEDEEMTGDEVNNRLKLQSDKDRKKPRPGYRIDALSGQEIRDR